MTGRKGLTWVTALTIASLLLGIGALNALAEGHGGEDHGGATGRTNAAHQQETPHAGVAPGNREGEDDGDHHRATRTPTPTGTVVTTARGDDDDERATRTATPSTTTPTATPTMTTTPGTVTPTATGTADVERKRARDGNDDDVVTAPAVGAANGDDSAGD